MPLIDIVIRHAKPREKAYELADMQGLFLLISPSGSKLWRMKYRFGGAGRKLSFGPYPQVSLRDARKHRDDARDLLAALRRRELDRLGQQVAADTGRTFHEAESGNYVAGTYSRRFTLASGRVAIIEVITGDGGLGLPLARCGRAAPSGSIRSIAGSPGWSAT